MDDTPQGGAGGVPLHHGAPEPPPEHERPPDTVKTLRAGKPAAEQKAGPAEADGTADHDGPPTR